MYYFYHSNLVTLFSSHPLIHYPCNTWLLTMISNTDTRFPPLFWVHFYYWSSNAGDTYSAEISPFTMFSNDDYSYYYNYYYGYLLLLLYSLYFCSTYFYYWSIFIHWHSYYFLFSSKLLTYLVFYALINLVTKSSSFCVC